MSSRSKGTNKERSLAGILREVGYKVQGAPNVARFIGKDEHGKARWAPIASDLFGCLDHIAVRKGTAPLFLQATDLRNRAAHRDKMEKEMVPYIHLGIMGDARLVLFSWGKTKQRGYSWLVEEYWENDGWMKLGSLKLDGTFEPKAGSLSVMFSPIPNNGGKKT